MSERAAKRTSVSLTRGQLKELNDLCKLYGENEPKTIIRAIQYLHRSVMEELKFLNKDKEIKNETK